MCELKVTNAMKVVLGIVTGLMLVGTASADSVWNGVGKAAKRNHASAHGSLASGAHRSSPIWEFTSGPPPLSSLHSLASQNGLRPFWVAAVNAPLFRLWITGPEGTSGGNSKLDGSDFEGQEHSDGPGLLQSQKGLWSDLEIAAEPATGLLVALGLVCAGLMRPKKKRSKDPTVWENLG